MNILTASSAITEIVETTATFGARAYVLGGEIFTVGSILWVLSFMGNMIEGTFKAGVVSGEFYKTHLHSYTIKGIALVILTFILAYEGAILVYQNRQEIIEYCNDLRNEIGSYFTYESPVLV